MIRTLAILITLAAPATAGDAIEIYLDGQPVGTLQLLEYRLAAGEIWIDTNEGVTGCQQAVVYRDRFEL